MPNTPIRVAVTGAAGSIAYSLLFRIASGEMFGREQSIDLRLLERSEALEQLDGVRMELDDCAYPLLRAVHIGSDPHEIFDGAHYAILVGAKPRGKGMERSDLLKENSKIFVEQGKALNAVADRNVKVLVVGNPCNTNCLIALKNAPDLNPHNFHAMTRLDQNRASIQLAHKAGVDVTKVTNVTIWGNHSSTQVPDYINARIDNHPALSVLQDQKWLEHTFIEKVQQRGSAIIAARGHSSSASAANAVVDHVKSLLTPTPEGRWFSSAVYTAGNKYGLDEDLIFSLPCRSKGDGDYEVVSDVPWNDFLKEKIAKTEKELIEEREEVTHGRIDASAL